MSNNNNNSNSSSQLLASAADLSIPLTGDNFVQAIIRCNLDLHSFTNIDLFSQGLYQVRVHHRFSNARDYSIRASVSEPNSDHQPPSSAAAASNGVAFSSPCRVIYKNEVMRLRDSFAFEFTVQVDCCCLLKSFRNIKLHLFVDLYYVRLKQVTCEDQGVIGRDSALIELTKDMNLLCSRTFDIIFDPRVGVHTHLNVLFDYVHLCAVQMSLHYGLMAIVPLCSPPTSSSSVGRRNQCRNVGIFSAIFSQRGSFEDGSSENSLVHGNSDASDDVSVEPRLSRNSDRYKRALSVYRNICKLLLTAREQMVISMRNLSDGARSIQSSRSAVQSSSAADIGFLESDNLNELLLAFINAGGGDPILDVYNIDSVAHQKITQCSAQNILVWTTLIEKISRMMVTFMKRERHLKRVKRLAECFFYLEMPKYAALSPTLAEQTCVFNLLRQSDYFGRTFPLIAECKELDGSSASLPVVFEECYVWTSPRSQKSDVISASSGDQTEPKMRSSRRDHTAEWTTRSVSISNLLNLRDQRKSKYDEWSFSKDDCPVKLVSYRSLDGRINVSCGGSAAAAANGAAEPSHSLTQETLLTLNPSTSAESGSLASVTEKTSPESTSSAHTSSLVPKQPPVSRARTECTDFYAERLLSYVKKKEAFKNVLSTLHQRYHRQYVLYSDMLKPAHIYSISKASMPWLKPRDKDSQVFPVHLIVCVHGLDGSYTDLRLFQTFIKQAADKHMRAAGVAGDPSRACLSFDFLMASSNRDTTFDGFEPMVSNLFEEIKVRIKQYEAYDSEYGSACDDDDDVGGAGEEKVFARTPARISFVGHSLGNLVIRGLVADDRFEPLRCRLHTFLSVCGPHLGTMFATNAIVNFGMWLMQKWKKSLSLAQLALKDHPDFKQTFLYKLSKKPCFEFFKNILLLASPQDHYVPIHSARIEPCKQAFKDNQCGSLYVEMVSNILTPVLKAPSINFIRYTAFMNYSSSSSSSSTLSSSSSAESAIALVSRNPDGSYVSSNNNPTTTNTNNNNDQPNPSLASLSTGSSAANTANNLIGRSAHVAALDSEAFVEKLVIVSVGKYFL